MGTRSARTNATSGKSVVIRSGKSRKPVSANRVPRLWAATNGFRQTHTSTVTSPCVPPAPGIRYNSPSISASRYGSCRNSQSSSTVTGFAFGTIAGRSAGLPVAPRASYHGGLGSRSPSLQPSPRRDRPDYLDDAVANAVEVLVQVAALVAKTDPQLDPLADTRYVARCIDDDLAVLRGKRDRLRRRDPFDRGRTHAGVDRLP